MKHNLLSTHGLFITIATIALIALGLVLLGAWPGDTAAASPLAVTLTPTLMVPTETPTPSPTLTPPTPTEPPTDPTPTPTITPEEPSPTPEQPTPTTPPDDDEEEREETRETGIGTPLLIPVTGELPVILPSAVLGLQSSLDKLNMAAAFSSISLLPDSGLPLQISIPSQGMRAAVRPAMIAGETWDIAGLGVETAWLEGSSRPGLGGSTALAGHISVRGVGDGPFRRLHLLSPGDLLVVNTASAVYTYQVREQRVVQPTEVELLLQSDGNQLALVTCTGWNAELETYASRRLVLAELVEVEPLTQKLMSASRIQ